LQARRARPKNNADYWQQKIRRNRERDASHLLQLKEAGWQALVLWECELHKTPELREKIQLFLEKI
jgi:DNA mismatch endonuclease, patch repair protein